MPMPTTPDTPHNTSRAAVLTPLSSNAIEAAQDQARDASAILADLARRFPTAQARHDAARMAEPIFDPSNGVLRAVTTLIGTVSDWVDDRVSADIDSGPAYDLRHRLRQAAEDLWDISEALGATSLDLAELPASPAPSRARAALSRSTVTVDTATGPLPAAAAGTETAPPGRAVRSR